MKRNNILSALLITILLSVSCSCRNECTIHNGNLTIKVNDKMQYLIVSDSSPLMNEYSTADDISVEGIERNFKTTGIRRIAISDEFGNGRQYIITGESKVDNSFIKKEIFFSLYDDFPSTAISKITYTNLSSDEISVNGWITDHFKILSNGDNPPFWSFQGESTEERNSWIIPVSDNFSQNNYMGMNDSDYGGGIPVICLWRKDIGIAIGHLENHPELVSLPVKMESDYAEISIEKNYQNPLSIPPKGEISSCKTFISIFKGDCFSPLRNYAKLLEKVSVVMPESEPDAFEASWCAWGYGRKFTISEILGTIDKVKELGIKWVTIDDGYQIAEGDWDLNRKRFPNGDADMKMMVDAIHKAGLKAQLWWAPLAADPGCKFLREHPDAIIINKEGKPQNISWWDSWYLSPVDKDVIEETERLVTKFIGEYGFDGLKLDGQQMNAVPLDYSKVRMNDDPEKGYHMLPLFFKTIYDTAREINPHAVIQNCPCGCCISVYNLPYANQTVASDPENSWQIRSKGYVLRAIAPKTAYYGDHVELSDNADDFPTQLGIGAVIGTKFTYPKDNLYSREKNYLNKEREILWKKAFDIYNEKMLSKGEYVPGLYDIGYDIPETHVIKKDGKLYYAFYSNVPVNSVVLRGLENGKKYKVIDYYNNVALGEITASDNTVLKVNFKDFLLIETINN